MMVTSVNTLLPQYLFINFISFLIQNSLDKRIQLHTKKTPSFCFQHLQTFMYGVFNEYFRSMYILSAIDVIPIHTVLIFYRFPE